MPDCPEIFKKSPATTINFILILVVMFFMESCAPLKVKPEAKPVSEKSVIEPIPSLPALPAYKLYDIAGIRPNGYQIVTVISYHDIRENSTSIMQVTPRQFEEQMAYLKENGFHVISLESFFDFINLKRGLPEKSVVITFDDGWRSSYTIAYPVLEKYGFPATLFIYTDFISANNSNALTWEMLKEMNDKGLDVQVHSKTHQLGIAWRKKDETEENYRKRLEQELLIPKNLVEQHIGKKVKYIAYAYGQFSSDFIKAAQSYGYQGGLTVIGATVEGGAIVTKKANPFYIDPFEVHRIQILSNATLNKFKSKLQSFQPESVYDGRYDELLNLPFKDDN